MRGVAEAGVRRPMRSVRSSKLMPAGSRKRSRAGCNVAWLAVSGSNGALCRLRPPNHCRLASGAAVPRIGASRWLRRGGSASTLAADRCFNDAPPPVGRLLDGQRARLSKHLVRRSRRSCVGPSGRAADLASASRHVDAWCAGAIQ